MEIVICIIIGIGMVAIFFAGTEIDNIDGYIFCPFLIGAMLILAAVIITEDYVKEEAIRKYVNNELIK